MEFNEYLGLMGYLYREGIRSNFHPGLLKKYGGSLALASIDTVRIHTEEDAFLWIDIDRTANEVYHESRKAWVVHYKYIMKLVDEGETHSMAVFNYLKKFNISPHKPGQLKKLTRKVQVDQWHEYDAWMVPVIQARQYWRRGSRIMGNTFGAIATGVALILTAEDWNNATPDEWNKAMNVGEVGVLVGNMMGAKAGAHQQRADMSHTTSRPVRDTGGYNHPRK